MAVERQAAIDTLNEPFNNKDVRRILCGGDPQDPGVPPYPNSQFWDKYISRLLFPQLFSEEEMFTLFNMTHQAFYALVNKFAVPFLQTGGPQGGTLKPHRMTADSLMGLLVLKCQENLSDRLLGCLYGESGQTVNQWLRNLRDYIYQNDEWLQRQRNLSNAG